MEPVALWGESLDLCVDPLVSMSLMLCSCPNSSQALLSHTFGVEIFPKEEQGLQANHFCLSVVPVTSPFHLAATPPPPRAPCPTRLFCSVRPLPVNPLTPLLQFVWPGLFAGALHLRSVSQVCIVSIIQITRCLGCSQANVIGRHKSTHFKRTKHFRPVFVSLMRYCHVPASENEAIPPLYPHLSLVLLTEYTLTNPSFISTFNFVVQ